MASSTKDFRVRLEELFFNEAFFRIVLQFAQASFNSEVVLFWKELFRIQQGLQNAMPLKEFFQTFVMDSDSAMCVTVPYEVVLACKAAAESANPQLPQELLDEAWQMIHNVLNGFWPIYCSEKETL